MAKGIQIAYFFCQRQSEKSIIYLNSTAFIRIIGREMIRTLNRGIINVDPLNTNPAFAKEHQDPYITRMPHFHAPPIMEPHILVSQVQDEPKHEPCLSTAFVDEQNIGDAVEIDSCENTQDEADRQDDMSGFIFMCGRNKKHDCYSFHVFGLPLNKQERIEKIKPGA
uniref:DCD domain-containing protein n=1 Tax=Solanum lycopersicum TaxID=4081 RepID=A0A3Q7HTH2_SOLLC